MEWFVILTYSIALLFICVFSIGQLHLTWHYLKRQQPKAKELESDDFLPQITVQLPIYNEFYVIDRLIESVSQLDYPHDKLEIQVLDDSTDETVERVAELVDQLSIDGLNIKHVRRPNRTGFKAGALKYGLENTSSDYVAIFDADFLPKPDFLKKTISHFQDPKIGMVQTRWGHLNKEYSWITKMQAFGLDAHFTVEQTGRNSAGSFMNFNGTAGVWRKECILEAGGWQSDTLTEDLDLSYRAQLKGWNFKYLEDVISPAELPVIMSAVKSQQYRWNKGAAETARKNLGNVLLAKIPFRQKTHALLHLLNSSVFVFLIIASVLSIPMLFLKENSPELSILFDLGSVFILGFVAIGIFYWVASKKIAPAKTYKYYSIRFPLFLTFSMGLTLHNAMAVMEGYLGIKSSFIRTPKFNVIQSSDSWTNNKYVNSKISFATLIEGLLSLYFIFGIASGIYLMDFGLILFHAMLAIGFGAVFVYSIRTSSNL